MIDVKTQLMNARCRLMTREPWYGHIAMSMEWIPSEMKWIANEKARTMGVRIVDGGVVQCLYYPKFVESLSLKELYAVIQHEIEHIVRAHCIRSGSRQHDIWNIAADMCVNGPKSRPRIGFKETDSASSVVLPLNGDIVWIPQGWPQDGTSEKYYEMLVKEAKHVKIGFKGSGQGGQEYQNSPYGGHFDDHSVWNQTTLSDDEVRQSIKDLVTEACNRNPGSVPGHLKEAIESLSKPVVKWCDILRSFFGRHLGNRRTTYSRRNRRNDSFGVPGVSHHASATVNVIIDTSGSISKIDLGKFFAEIDAISSRAKVNILQWDHAYQGYSQYRSGDWRRFVVNGRGGTDMEAPIDWMIKNGCVADVQVMLTDGYVSNWHKPCMFPLVTVLTSDQPGPNWGINIRLDSK